MGVPYTFGTATTSIPLSNLDANFNTPVTIGNATVGLGNTVTTVGNLTLTNATISSGNVTVTTGIFGAGSNTAPSITTTGDTNTGIFFPAADTIAFTEGGVESMRITSAGSVGIGTASPNDKLDVNGADAFIRVDRSNGEPGITMRYAGSSTNRGDILVTSGGAMYFTAGGSTERMRITSAGEVLVGGTTELNSFSGGFSLQRTNNAPNFNLYRNDTSVSSGNVLGAIAYWGNDTTSNTPTTLAYINGIASGDHAAGDNPTDLAFGTTADGSATVTERMRITSNGDLLVGTSTAFYNNATRGLIEINGSNTSLLAFKKADTVAGYIQAATNIEIQGVSNTAMTFATNDTERMRINSSGDLLVGTTSPLLSSARRGISVLAPTGNFVAGSFANDAGANAQTMDAWNKATSGNNAFVSFFTEGGSGQERGGITYNRAGGLIVYATTSDYRLKKNIVDLPNALQTVLQLKPRQFDWKETGNTTTGFIAHELAEICPHAVIGSKDDIDDKGNPKYQNVDTSFLVATLTKAIQELKTELDSVKAELQTLKGN